MLFNDSCDVVVCDVVVCAVVVCDVVVCDVVVCDVVVSYCCCLILFFCTRREWDCVRAGETVARRECAQQQCECAQSGGEKGVPGCVWRDPHAVADQETRRSVLCGMCFRGNSRSRGVLHGSYRCSFPCAWSRWSPRGKGRNTCRNVFSHLRVHWMDGWGGDPRLSTITKGLLAVVQQECTLWQKT